MIFGILLVWRFSGILELVISLISWENVKTWQPGVCVLKNGENVLPLFTIKYLTCCWPWWGLLGGEECVATFWQFPPWCDPAATLAQWPQEVEFSELSQVKERLSYGSAGDQPQKSARRTICSASFNQQLTNVGGSRRLGTGRSLLATQHSVVAQRSKKTDVNRLNTCESDMSQRLLKWDCF